MIFNRTEYNTYYLYMRVIGEHVKVKIMEILSMLKMYNFLPNRILKIR